MGVRMRGFGHLPPSPQAPGAATMNRMNTMNRKSSSADIDDHAADLLRAAQAIQEAAGRRGSSGAATAAVETLEEALQALSASWYQVAADAVVLPQRRQAARRAQPWPAAQDGLSREQEVRLIATLHEVAAAFAKCARVCRRARPTLVSLSDERTTPARPEDGLPRLAQDERPASRVA
jgi:hypothetical protein